MTAQADHAFGSDPQGHVLSFPIAASPCHQRLQTRRWVCSLSRRRGSPGSSRCPRARPVPMHLVIGLLDLLLRGGAGHPQHLVIVLLGAGRAAVEGGGGGGSSTFRPCGRGGQGPP